MRLRIPVLSVAFVLAVLGAGVLAAPSAAAPTRALPADWHRAASFTAWGPRTYRRPEGREALRALRATGTTHVLLNVVLSVHSGRSSVVVRDPAHGATDASLRETIAEARALGMTVGLTPHVVTRADAVDAGHLDPASPATFFRTYGRRVLELTRLAEASGARLIEVGAELSTVSRHEKRWRELIRAVRRRFTGQLTFSVDQLDFDRVRFWDAVDLIGIHPYMPLDTGEPNPSVERLVSTWRRSGHVGKISRLQRRFRRPVIFTEVGYGSHLGTARKPWESARGKVVSQEAQRNAYEALLQVFTRYSWFRGVYWWRWNAGSFDPADGSHSPRGKLAEQTLREWYLRRAP